jgi:carbonic anhydrase
VPLEAMQARGALALAAASGFVVLLVVAMAGSDRRVTLATISIPSREEQVELGDKGRAVWGYDNQDWAAMDPKEWGECAGKTQSPIDIKRAYWEGFWSSK